MQRWSGTFVYFCFYGECMSGQFENLFRSKRKQKKIISQFLRQTKLVLLVLAIQWIVEWTVSSGWYLLDTI